MHDFVIRAEDPATAEVRELLDRHLTFTRENSPPEECYALDENGLDAEDVFVFGLREEGELLGIGALKRIGPRHAELKSMHTAEAARKRGVGRAMLDQLFVWASESGYSRISLETGTAKAFESARRLYESAGFRSCEPFGNYVSSPNSVYMTRKL
ncbi:putative acetyltransferase [Actinopolyspora xinjiangensis]|uniref:Putative acetyltransferase n=1 Tax=Actinopolyspora xinjiangensis TaxID=405564 RepID=A0A1H0RI66_9ACTN|nr:GNAT family N-acetyltransferase [Actinopolyspora xinjiangensis]SDP29090.1 putative acetyltransferase [Actinopolyspora xinjiangensis]